jgi:ribosomal protein L16 Arg81 hydroxylase
MHFDHHFVHTILVQCEGRKRVRLVSDLDWPALETSGTRSNQSEWDGLDPIPEGLVPIVYECTLEKGDFVFIPGGWYHGVLNLTASSTYSYDYVDSTNLMRWLPEALTDEVYREFFLRG